MHVSSVPQPLFMSQPLHLTRTPPALYPTVSRHPLHLSGCYLLLFRTVVAHPYLASSVAVSQAGSPSCQQNEHTHLTSLVDLLTRRRLPLQPNKPYAGPPQAMAQLAHSVLPQLHLTLFTLLLPPHIALYCPSLAHETHAHTAIFGSLCKYHTPGCLTFAKNVGFQLQEARRG